MKIQVNKIEVGKRIFYIRKNMDLNLEQFGKLFDTSKSIVLRWENGTSLPNKIRLHKIAEKGKITVNELLYGSVEEFVRENFPAEASEFYINYIRTNNIIFDINNPVNIIDTIDNKIRFEFIKHYYAENKYKFAHDDLKRLSSTIKSIKNTFENTLDLNIISNDDISIYIKWIEENIEDLEKLKEYLKLANQ